jgi:outer membrane protein assembly factor BamB
MRALVLGLALLAAAGCGRRDVILEGPREAIGATAAIPNEVRPISLPAVTANADWTHRAGGPDHRLSHPALPGALTLAFATPVGEGNSRQARITADPVVAGGRIFTLDARATVSAVGLNGALLWQTDVAPGTDGRDDASGGGIATDGTAVFVTTGYGHLIRLDAATGAILWDQDLDAPGNAAPTVVGELVYVVGRDSTGWAVETDTGRVRWTLNGVPGGATITGGAGVAVADGMAIFPFPSGEVIGAFAEGGLTRWSSVVAGARDGQAAAVAATDIGADPVIDGETLYVGNTSGRLVAMNLASGERLWTATEGAVGPVWPEGGSVFLINDLNELVRLDGTDGTPVWRVALPRFTSDRPRRQDALFAHFGPVLASGRLIVASSDGLIRQFAPETGALIGQTAMPTGAASNPAVAGGTLYVQGADGSLLAFR